MPVIIYSEINIASTNICKYIIDKYEFEKIKENEWVKKNKDKGEKIRIIKVKENVLDFYFNENVDYLIVASTHKSESNTKSLCVHVPGNWSKADLGGEKETLNICYASKMKTILLNIYELAKKRSMLNDWEITLEVDHHGPTPPKINEKTPIMFVEIGSSEEQWTNQEAISLIGDAIINSISDNTIYPVVLGFGGGHYATKFNKFELNKNSFAISHILPKYSFDTFKENSNKMFKQAIEKNVEKIDKIIMDWKGLKSEQRQLIIDLCEKHKIIWEKV